MPKSLPVHPDMAASVDRLFAFAREPAFRRRSASGSAPLRVALGLGVLWMLLQLAASLALEWRGHSYENLYRDPIAIGGLPLHSGLLSNIGCLLMAAAASCALFGYASLDASARRSNGFLLWGGLISAVLAVDDLLLLHDGYFGRIGIPESVSQGTYGVFILFWLAHYRRELLRTGLPSVLLLTLALFGLGASASIDIVIEKVVPMVGVFEEPLKQWGFLFWLAFLALAGRNALADARGHATSAGLRSADI